MREEGQEAETDVARRYPPCHAHPRARNARDARRATIATAAIAPLEHSFEPLRQEVEREVRREELTKRRSRAARAGGLQVGTGMPGADDTHAVAGTLPAVRRPLRAYLPAVGPR